MRQRVIVMNFDENAKAYEAFSKIKQAQLERKIQGEQMAVVTHSEDGQHQFKIEDFLDFTGNNQSAKGGMIGMLIGILGGSLGMILGWFGGSMIGASKDSREIRQAQSIFDFVGKKIDEGQTGLILIANEEDNRPLNDLIMYELGGEITRFELEEVKEEIQKAHEVEESAREKVKQTWKEKHAQK